MSIYTLHSSHQDIKTAVQEIKAQLNGAAPELVVYFASPKYQPGVLAAEMQRVFDRAQTFGCTTAGEIVSGKMLNDSIVAMAFENELDDFLIRVVENISTQNGIPAAFDQFEQHFKSSLLSLDIEKYVGVILIDGLSMAEEKLMEQIGDLSSITFIGGSAGDDLAFKETHVFANGKAFSNAAILAILKPAKGFDVIKTESFSKMGVDLEATKVDEDKRKVVEFNHKPAVQAYAEALDVPANKVVDQFLEHPLGLMVGDEPYVRSPQQVDKDQIIFYCSIRQGMKLSLLKSADIIRDTQKALQEKEAQLGKIRGILNFNCILRSVELRNKNLSSAYGQLFSSIPTVGFSTYGEEYIGHMNQTATMLVFK